MKWLPYLFLLMCLGGYIKAHTQVLPGAHQTTQYVPLLKNKRVALFANHTSYINQTHLLDTLISLGVQVRCIFAPEHGFRGTEEAGKLLHDSVDAKTGIPIISLYGKQKKPSNKQLEEIDCIVFDIQDVGVRFYTYISSLQYLLEAALENNKQFVLLDRPNPNADYVDGPILQPTYQSFIGMQPIPIVYGLTIGEYALMLNGEGWLHTKVRNNSSTNWLTVIPCANYTHQTAYKPPIPPSPNLKTYESIRWYPTTCLFEGTTFSEGRGTSNPFCMYGHPQLAKKLYSFVPKSNQASLKPKWLGVNCYGFNLQQKNPSKKIELQLILQAYKLMPKKDSFFLEPSTDSMYFFDKLAGTDILRKQIIAQVSETKIRKTWKTDLIRFLEIRKKYLLYPDFKKY